MRLLYGVVGVGMGHAIRSKAVLERLVSEGHTALVLASGKAFDFLSSVFADSNSIIVEKIEGLKFSMKGNTVSTSRTAVSVLWRSPRSIYHNIKVYFEHIDEWDPDLVISDFESLTGLYAITHKKPLIVVDNIHLLDRCKHDKDIWKGNAISKLLAQAVVKFKVVGADHYFIASPFFPPVRLPRTTLIGPILRKEILGVRREPGEHFLVYLHSGGNKAFYEVMQSFPHKFICYGADKEEQTSNITFKAFDEKNFVEDLRTCKALISSAGSSLMSEAIYLKVPMLALPLGNQYEQVLNARYLHKLGLGMCADYLGHDALDSFCKSLDMFEENLANYRLITDDPLKNIIKYINSKKCIG